MIRIETEEIEVTRKEEKIVKETCICNKCGKEITPNYAEDFIHFYESFGYESHFDGETWRWDICPECLLEWIKTFKYVPSGFFQDEYWGLTIDEHQKTFDDWKRTEKWEQFKYITYEEFTTYAVNMMSVDVINEIIRKYHPDMPLLEDIK